MYIRRLKIIPPLQQQQQQQQQRQHLPLHDLFIHTVFQLDPPTPADSAGVKSWTFHQRLSKGDTEAEDNCGIRVKTI